jgi:alanine racemase
VVAQKPGQTDTYNEYMAPDTAPTFRLPCWLEVDLDSIGENVRALRRWVGPSTQVAAVVKAQGYGVGAAQVAHAALRGGAQWLAVARVHEGEELRQGGITAPILVLTRTEPSEAARAVLKGLSVTVDTPELARALSHEAARRGLTAGVHLKVDTGLHRFGVEPERALPMARKLASLDGLDVQGLYTHFASADEDDLSYTAEQLACFERVTAQLEDAGYRFPIRHAANSAATLAFPASHLGLVRTGLSLYGCSPMGALPPGLSLKPAVSLHARIARISCLAPGEGVGYGQIWHARRPSRIALVTAGYADGVPRPLSNVGETLVRGSTAPIVGRVSMDQTTVDVTDIVQAQVGDPVTFFGPGEGGAIDLMRFADAAGSIPHAALTGVGGRVARVYRQDGEIVGVARLCDPRDVLATGQGTSTE